MARAVARVVVEDVTARMRPVVGWLARLLSLPYRSADRSAPRGG